MSLQEALGNFPSQLRNDFISAVNDGCGLMAKAMMDRGDMPMDRAFVSGMALDPRGRLLMDEALDYYARPDKEFPQEADEVVIGGGAHAAIYAAVRNQRYNIKTLVIEKSDRFGGTFAMTRLSSFFLNSRNRPGPAGVPGSRDALNVIPGAMMQPSDIGGFEYQANADLGLVVRMTLALNATLRQATVEYVAQNGPRWIVNTDRGTVRAKRVVVATGIGRENNFDGALPDGKRIFSYNQFMARFDQEMFPLRNLGRVAVIGGGDSGKTVVEALTGYGPSTRGSVASLDYVPQISWYGIERDMSKDRWLICNRTRYKPLAALFPDGQTGNARIKGYEKAKDIFPLYNAVQIDGRPYDTVIVCTGFDMGNGWRSMIGFESGPEIVARPFRPVGSAVSIGRASDNRDVIVIGPAARLEFESAGDREPLIPENKVALFRLAPRTAALAAVLPPA